MVSKNSARFSRSCPDQTTSARRDRSALPCPPNATIGLLPRRGTTDPYLLLPVDNGLWLDVISPLVTLVIRTGVGGCRNPPSGGAYRGSQPSGVAQLREASSPPGWAVGGRRAAAGLGGGGARYSRGVEETARPIRTTYRLFLCIRCRRQVSICAACDRGQWYCGKGCGQQRRREGLRADCGARCKPYARFNSLREGRRRRVGRRRCLRPTGPRLAENRE
jgi:hypothetical protein